MAIYCTHTLRNAYGVPIFERPPPKYSAYSIMKLLLDPNIDKSRRAKKQPIGTTHSATFVVDLSKLDHPDDVKRIILGNGSIVVLIQKCSAARLMSWSL